MAKPELREIATTRDGRDITRGYLEHLDYLYPQDPLLRSRAFGFGNNQSGYRIYEDLLQDDRVHSTFSQRRSAVVSKDTEVVPGGDSAADMAAAAFVEEELARLRWDTITSLMLYGIHYGYSVAECLWMVDGPHVRLADIKVRNRRRFVFDLDYRPKLVTHGSPMGEELPERKFWSFWTGADNDDEPYGRGLGHFLYWPVWFKKNHVAFWLKFQEKFGGPTVVGKYGKAATPDEKRKLLEATRAVHADNGVVIPDDMMLELLEAMRGGTVDYDRFHFRMQQVITQIVLSQTMTTDDGSSHSQAEVHWEVRKDLVGADADLVCESFNRQVVRWLCEWNFPDAVPPRVRRVMDEPPDTNRLSERDKRICEMGWRPTREYVEETYNIRVEERAEPPMPAPGGPTGPGGMPAGGPDDDGTMEFAEAEVEALEAAVEAISAGRWRDLAAPLVEPILRKARMDPEGLADDIASLYPDMDDDAIGEALARALFVGDVWGRLRAEEDR